MEGLRGTLGSFGLVDMLPKSTDILCRWKVYRARAEEIDVGGSV